MSSMIKKKGALSFKPKAPQARRGTGVPPSQTSSTPRPSVDRQSQTPAPSTRPTPALSPPPPLPPSDGSRIPSQLVIDDNSTSPAPSTIASIPAVAEETPISKSVAGPENASGVIDHVLSHLSHQSQPHEVPASTASVSEVPPLPAPAASPIVDQDVVQRAPIAPMLTAEAVHTSAASSSSQVTMVEAQPSSDQVPPVSSSSFLAPAQIISSNTIATQDGSEDPVDVIIAARPQGNLHSDSHTNVDLSTMGAGESVQEGQLVPVAALNVDGTSGTILTHITGRKKQPTKRRRVEEDDPLDVRPTIEVQVHKRARIPKELVPKKPRKRKEKEPAQKKPRKKRAATPEDAEDQEIDQSTVKMADLCKDPRIGRKFSRHAEIKQRDMEKKAKAKLLKDHPELAISDEGRADPPLEEVAAPEESFAPTMQMRVVDDQIVFDHTSTLVDRHAQNAIDTDMEVIEENDFTRVTNSGTHMKTTKSEPWTRQDYELFYTGIKMFGTDFEMISNMFAGRRNRRQIKLKFNKEERECPDKIDAALRGEKIQIDFEEYKSHTGLEYQDLEVLEREQRQLEEEHASEFEGRKRAEEDENKNRRAKIYGKEGENGPENEGDKNGDGTIEGGKASAASKSKKKGTKKKNVHAVGGGGEEVEVLGEV